MKTLLIIFAFTLLVTACTGSQKKTQFELSEDFVSLKVCTNTSKQELTEIAEQLKTKKDIILGFDKTTFNSDGTIDELNLSIQCPGGIRGNVQADLYMSDDYYGFFRDYKPNSNPPFRCGAI